MKNTSEVQHPDEALNSSTQLDPLCAAISNPQMAVISGVHALWPPRAKPGNKGARLLWPCNDYDFKAEARRGLVALVGCYQSKTMYNNNQVRGLCKFIGMLQTPTSLSDYKRNIYELKDIKKQAENWFTIALFSSCPGADYAVVKLRDERPSRCDFHFAANTPLASL